MSITDTYFLALLRAFLLRQPAPPPPAGLDAKALFSLAELHDLSGVVGYMLKDGNILEETYTAKFTRRFYETVFLYSRIAHEIRSWQNKLAAAGIPHALLKGAVLRQYYPVPELRTSGDVDIFVPASAASDLSALLAAEHISVRHHDATQTVIDLPPLLLEFHHDLTPDAGNDSPALVAALMNPPMVGKGPCRELEMTFHFIYLLSHQMHHFRVGSAGVRTFMDLAVLLQHGFSGDTAIPENTLREWGLLPYAQTALSLTQRWFGISSPWGDTLDDEQADFLTSYILSAGQFGWGQNRGGVRMEPYIHRRFPRLRTTWAALFPSRQTLMADSRYAAIAKTCLPLAWLSRCFHAICHRRTYVRHTLHEIVTATDTAKERVRLLQTLHIPFPKG